MRIRAGGQNDRTFRVRICRQSRLGGCSRYDGLYSGYSLRRMMVKAPVVMAVAAVSLAVGIAANTVTFSVANGFFFKPFPYAEQDRRVVVYENHQRI